MSFPFSRKTADAPGHGGGRCLTSDVGAHKCITTASEPNTCLISNGFCTMGFAMPGSVGAKFAFPDKKILSISGDAGFSMNVQELETAVRLKKNIVAMVWVDGEYGLIKWKQQDHFNGKHSDLQFGNPDFAKLAESTGGQESSLPTNSSQRRKKPSRKARP